MISIKEHANEYFLLVVILGYAITFLLSAELFYSAILDFVDILTKVIPILFLIFALMALTNYFVKPRVLVKYLGKESGLKGWLLAIVFGMLSSGPIYMWYPLLNDLQRQGMRTRFIATFLYNRAIKIPLLPLLFVYFGVMYSLVLMVVMIGISVVQGLTTEKLMEWIK